MSINRPYILVLVVIVIIGAIYYLTIISSQPAGPADTQTVTPRPGDSTVLSAVKAAKYELAKEITTPDGFINTDGRPITINEFIGKKVILIDFWTYSCINCQRTLPYLNDWYDRYRDEGLEIIGIHTPEFDFEKDYDNVAAAVEKFGIKFPVVLDNDFSTWRAYDNHYWPHKYLIDIDGYIVYDHIGEGSYDETEKAIQTALAERLQVLGKSGQIPTDLTTVNSQPSAGTRSPETYFGSQRNQTLANGEPGLTGTQSDLLLPDILNPDQLYLGGSWQFDPEYATNQAAGDQIGYYFTARDVFLVASAGTPITVDVSIDDQPVPEDLAGADIVRLSDGRTIVTIQAAGLYRLIQGDQPTSHKITLTIEQPGLRAFTFTFG